MKIIGLTGVAYSGKGVVSERLCRTHGFTATRFADPFKNMLRIGLGLNADQLDGRRKEDPIHSLGGVTPRRLMRTLGSDWGRRMISEDLWVRIWERSLGDAGGAILVDDVRYPNEAQAIRDKGGIIWRVVRPGIAIGDHPSERAVALIEPDAILKNDGNISELNDLVDSLHGQLVKEGWL